jgi:acetyl-CoA C-acetyltransferase
MANMGDSATLMLNAPVPAAREVLANAGLTLGDIDLFEINEAFAVVAEKFIRDLDLDRDKVDVNGGSIALGRSVAAFRPSVRLTMYSVIPAWSTSSFAARRSG